MLPEYFGVFSTNPSARSFRSEFEILDRVQTSSTKNEMIDLRPFWVWAHGFHPAVQIPGSRMEIIPQTKNADSK
jgi:hypothetical protein